MKRVAARLLALAAVAAALALGVRWAALRLAPHLARPVAELAQGVPSVVTASSASAGPSTPKPESAPSTSSSPAGAPSHGAAPSKGVKPPRVAHAKAAHGPSPIHITQAELDEALAGRCGGASTRPVRDGAGNVVGLSLHSVGSLGRYGLLSGDRLVSANGLPLRTPDEALAALGALQHATKVVFVFQRGDTKFSVAVELT